MKILESPPLSVTLLAICDALPHRFTRVRKFICRKIGRGSYSFPWTMDNGLKVAISNREVLIPYGVAAVCFAKKVWERPVERTIETLVKEGDVALDIGANIGYFSALLGRKVGASGRVVAFEPVPTTARQLELTKAANNSNNLTIFECGLGRQKTTASIHYDEAISGNSSLYARASSAGAISTQIEIETLDGLFAQKKIPRCQFVKMDVEGHEMETLAGGRNYLRESNPYILYEFNSETAGLAGYTLRDLVSLINEIMPGCEHFLVWGEGHLVGVDIDTVDVPLGCHIDLVAVPKEKLPAVRSHP